LVHPRSSIVIPILVPGGQTVGPTRLDGRKLGISAGQRNSSGVGIDHAVNDLIDVRQGKFAFG
jgi:hypothetical protein